MQEQHTSTASSPTTGDFLRQQSLETAEASLWYGPEDVSTRRPRDAVEKRAVGLGWFSLGLGVAEILAPGAVAKLIGASDGVIARGVIRACGVREVAAGLGILMQPRPNTFLWGRFAGDLMDLGLLAAQLATREEHTGRLSVAAALVGGVTALDAQTAMDLQRARRGQDLDAPGVHVKHSITINASKEEVYRFWRDLENLPKFMAHLDSVTVQDGKSSWRAKAPAGQTVEWEAEITADEPNTKIAWRSTEGASIPNQGCVYFVAAPGDRGTEVHVELTYEPPGGAFGALLAKLFGEEPKQQIKSDLRRLKQVIETGEVIRSDSSIHHGTHPAQPPRDDDAGAAELPERKPRQAQSAQSPQARDQSLSRNKSPGARPSKASPSSGEQRGASPKKTAQVGQSKESSTRAATKQSSAEKYRMPSVGNVNPANPLTSVAPPKPMSGAPGTQGTADTGSNEPRDRQPSTHFTNQGFGTTRDDDAS